MLDEDKGDFKYKHAIIIGKEKLNQDVGKVILL